MLAVFEKAISRPPEEFSIHSSATESSSVVDSSSAAAAELFGSNHPEATFYNFGDGNFMALSNTDHDPVLPRLVVAMDDIFCIFMGTVENMVDLRHHYGLGRQANEGMLVVEVYRVLRDRAPYPPDQLIKDFNGKFAFLLFDSKSKTLFAARDRDGGAHLHWGMVGDESLAFSDDAGIILQTCGRPTATQFPQGCIYLNTCGLVSFVHPMHKVKAVVMEDSGGGEAHRRLYFMVDLVARLPSIPRVGSSANWKDTAGVDCDREGD